MHAQKSIDKVLSAKMSTQRGLKQRLVERLIFHGWMAKEKDSEEHIKGREKLTLPEGEDSVHTNDASCLCTNGRFHLAHSLSWEQAAKMPASPHLNGCYLMPMFPVSLCSQHKLPASLHPLLSNTGNPIHLCLLIFASPCCSAFLSSHPNYYCPSFKNSQ